MRERPYEIHAERNSNDPRTNQSIELTHSHRLGDICKGNCCVCTHVHANSVVRNKETVCDSIVVSLEQEQKALVTVRERVPATARRTKEPPTRVLLTALQVRVETHVCVCWNESICIYRYAVWAFELSVGESEPCPGPSISRGIGR